MTPTEENAEENLGPNEVVGLLEGIATTRAIRRFRPEPVSEDALATMLFAASRAPSGSNRQPFRFLVLRDGPRAMAARSLIGRAAREQWTRKVVSDGYERGSGASSDTPKARIAATMAHFVETFESVPVIVLPCLVRYSEPNPAEGGSIYPACQNLLLAARALGYGGVFTGWHRIVELDLRRLLDIPDKVFIAATIALGRPAGRHGPVRRQPLRDMVFEDGWGETTTWAVDPPGTRYTDAGPPAHSHK
ncbi:MULTISPECIES: nitroreductase family protein [unclassified Frankia]|uniref:nitroreductase family protein n=1 Tax=unclassified Frankia TaxID=2632575 RepID=UPI002AD29C16|nr:MULTISPECIES: nitroreductase family protein [unclassified Frankia]